MIEIKNISKEKIEILTRIDTGVNGCRLKDLPCEPLRLNPGETSTFLGYEPGVSYVIRPVKDFDQPRSLL